MYFKHQCIRIIFIFVPLQSMSAQVHSAWKDAGMVAASFAGLIGCLEVGKRIAKRPSVTTTLNNRLFPMHQRFHDDELEELTEDELREKNREHIEKSLTSLISRTQKRMAVIGVALSIATATKNQWWKSFVNNLGWMQARTELGLSGIYYFHGQEGAAHPLFSSPVRESVWIAATLLYTQFVDTYRSKELSEIYDFPELVFIWLSYLYEMGRIDA